jgi:DNA-binding MarR family transcriptional regulator
MEPISASIHFVQSATPHASPGELVDLIDLSGSAEDLDRLRLVLLRLSRRIRANSVGSLTPSQVAVFASVAKHGPCTIGRIAELEHVQPPSASKIVAALESKGLVERRADPDDRRCALIAATPAGRAYLDDVRAAGRSWLASQLATLADDDIAGLESALPALERLLADEE